MTRRILAGLLWLALPPYGGQHFMLQVMARTAVFGSAAGWLLGPVIVERLAGWSPGNPVVAVAAVASAWIVSVLAGLAVAAVNLAATDLVRD